MHILWITEQASFVGGCEHYISTTAALLKHHAVRSTLLYSPLDPADPVFLNAFDAAFPLVDLNTQSFEIDPDVIYVHQVYDVHILKQLAQLPYPVVRFYHDYWPFCLRRTKTSLFLKRPCHHLAPSCKCYPFGFTLSRKRRPQGKWEWMTFKKLRYEQSFNKDFTAYVVASHYMAEVLNSNGFPFNKTYIIPPYALPSVRTGEIVKQPRLLLFVGQLIHSKGVRVLLEAFAHLPEAYSCVIIGDGPLKETYEKWSLTQGMGSRIRFLGKLPPNQLEEWYAKASCCLVPTLSPEPFGMVGCEATRFGTPCVATIPGGNAEWLEEGKTGFLVPYGDVVALKDAILKICENPQLQAQMQKNAVAAYQKKFTSDIHLTALLNLLRQAIQSKKQTVQKQWGSFTAYSNPNAEEKIASILEEVCFQVNTHFSPKDYQGLLLIGGYGKGEGGVIFKEGKPKPHNNLDLLWILPNDGIVHEKKMTKQLFERLKPLQQRHGIEFDISAVSLNRLKNGPPLLIWHEMAHGHKWLAGSPHDWTSFPFFELQAIPPTEFLALMVNRGVLLLINEWLLQEKAPLTPPLKKVMIRHIMKAIIGFGDAWLYLMGEYHWSYQEKLKRIQRHPNAPKELQKAYQEAAEFRFQPNDILYENRDLTQWMEHLKTLFAPIYLAFEQQRLHHPEMLWKDYLSTFLQHSLKSDWTSLHGLKRKLKGWIHPPSAFLEPSLSKEFAFLSLTPFQRLMLLFPFVAFQKEISIDRAFLYPFLKVDPTHPENLANAYLQKWGRDANSNFIRNLETWGVTYAFGNRYHANKK